jgi:hypothetical protein
MDIKSSIMNKLTNFCLKFAKNYNRLHPGTYKSEDGKYTIVKVKSAKFNGPARVNNISGIVEIKSNLGKYPMSTILFLATWCFVRKIYFKEDSIMINNTEIDKKTIDLLYDCPEFSPKEGMLGLFSLLDTNDENLKRMENLVQNKKLLRKAFSKKINHEL